MENRGKFLKGFILGLLLMSLISAGGFYAYTSGAGLKGKRSLAGRETMEKINYLEDLIDLYYLNGPDQTKMKEGMYAGLVDGLEDPYSRYYTAEEYSALNEETRDVMRESGSSCSKMRMAWLLLCAVMRARLESRRD